MGRVSTTTLDELGRPVRISVAGMPAVVLTYDNDGRIATISKKADGQTRSEVRGYGTDGWVSSIKDALNEQVQF